MPPWHMVPSLPDWSRAAGSRVSLCGQYQVMAGTRLKSRDIFKCGFFFLAFKSLVIAHIDLLLSDVEEFFSHGTVEEGT